MTQYQQELADLTVFFQTANYPKAPFWINKYMKLTGDPKNFVEIQIHNIQSFHGTDLVKESMFKHLRELKGIVLANQAGTFHSEE